MNKIAAIIRYGSQNYGLKCPDSDSDYKILVYPSFADLYNSKTKHELPLPYDSEHYSTMDLRQFDKLLRKGNPNIIELLFSNYQNINFDNVFWHTYWEQVHVLYENGYVAQVWPQFVSAVKGMIFQYLDNEYSRKNVARAWYWMCFLFEVYMDEGKITAETWQHTGISMARKIRFGEIDLPSHEYFNQVWARVEDNVQIKTTNNFTFPSDLMYQAIKYEIIKGEYDA